MTAKIECLVHMHDVVGETPVWSTTERALYWVDVTQPTLHRWDAGSGEVTSHRFDQEIGCIGLRKQGGVVAAMRHGFYFIDTESGELTPINDPEPDLPGNSLNDGRCDRQGRFWAGSAWFGTLKPDENRPSEPTAALYRLDPNGSVTRVLDGIHETNTVAWSPDNRIMYVGDSILGEIYKFDFDAKQGTISNRRLFARTRQGESFHDGSAIDAEGYLWATKWGAWRIDRYAPDGTIERSIDLPVMKPAACCFGGPEMTTLYVTTARWDLSEADLEEQPWAGAVLTVDTGIKGLPEASFAG